MFVYSLKQAVYCRKQICNPRCLFIPTTDFIRSVARCLAIMSSSHKILVRIEKVKALIRLLLQEQSELGLHCLPRHFR